jgi:phospholipid N-methyltransferase
LPQLQPQRHESYVGEALVCLSETDFPASQLIQLVEELSNAVSVQKIFVMMPLGRWKKLQSVIKDYHCQS